MKLTAEREKLLAPLQAVIGVVERRQTMPVLANVLLGRGAGAIVDHRHGSRGRTGGCDGRSGSGARAISRCRAENSGYFACAARKSGRHADRRGRKSGDQGGAQPLQPVDLAGRRVSRDRRYQCAANGADPAQGFATPAGEDAFFDGAAGCSLLLERHAARNRRSGPACRGDRWPPPGALRSGPGGHGRSLLSKSSCRAKGYWSCSAF